MKEGTKQPLLPPQRRRLLGPSLPSNFSLEGGFSYGEPYLSKDRASSPQVTPNSYTGRDRSGPWDDSLFTEPSRFQDGLGEFRRVRSRCPDEGNSDPDPCQPAPQNRGCSLGTYSGLFAPYRTSARRSNSRASVMTNPNHGQKWTTSSPWFKSNEYANDLQEFLVGAFSGLSPLQVPEPVVISVTESINALDVHKTKATLEVRVNDTFSPSRSTLPRVLDGRAWYSDEVVIGGCPWSDSPVRPITDTSKENNINGLRVSTPWPDVPPADRNRIIRAATVSREIGTYAYLGE